MQPDVVKREAWWIKQLCSERFPYSAPATLTPDGAARFRLSNELEYHGLHVRMEVHGLPRWCWWWRTCQCRRCRRHGFDSLHREDPSEEGWQPAPVFLPRQFHGQRSLVGCSPWGRKESGTTERLTHLALHSGADNGAPLQHSCWKIPWTEEPERLQSMGLLRVEHD